MSPLSRLRVIPLALALSMTAPIVLAAEPLGEDQRFIAVDTHEQAIDLAELLKTRKAVLVNFWATWCALCKEEIPALAKLYAAHQADGIEIVGVNVAESPKKVQAYAEKLGINYPVVLDRDSAIAEAWNVVGLPVSVLVRADGTVGGPYSGYTADLAKDVEAVLAP